MSYFWLTPLRDQAIELEKSWSGKIISGLKNPLPPLQWTWKIPCPPPPTFKNASPPPLTLQSEPLGLKRALNALPSTTFSKAYKLYIMFSISSWYFLWNLGRYTTTSGAYLWPEVAPQWSNWSTSFNIMIQSLKRKGKQRRWLWGCTWVINGRMSAKFYLEKWH